MNAEEIAQRLGARRSGGGWEAHCPAHDDETPSLTISPGRGGGVVICCHAGCMTKDVLAAVGLTMLDLAPPRAERATIGSRKWGPVDAVYPYHDEDGTVLFRVVRHREPKSFHQERPNGRGGWVNGIAGVRRVLFRLPQLRAAIDAGEQIWIVEGEKDVLALVEAGCAATCNPMGAAKGTTTKWLPQYTEQLAGAKDVMIVADDDEAGYAHAAQVASALESLDRMVTVVKAAAGHNDAAAHLGAGRGLHEFVVVDLVPKVTADDDTQPMAMPIPPPMSTLLDAEFWNRRRLFRHVRDAAQATMTAPAAVLNNVFARASTLVHPSIRLPDVIGGFGTLDFIAAVIAETSGGKSSATVVAQRLLPTPPPPAGDEPSPWMMDMPIGSGEGIAQSFMVPELAPDAAGVMKPTGRQVVGRQALHFAIDEGKAFTQQADRAGTTVAATLATCWSGGGYGNLNADPTKRRIIEGGRTRVSAVINMQSSNAHLLWTPDLESIGFTGRMSFSSAHDPDAPDIADQPEWPGPLDWTPPPGVSGGGMIVVTYAPEIVTEIKTTRLGVLRGTEVVDRRQSQHLLMRCKIAALLAILDDRLDVNLEDWDLAAQILANSAAVLEHLDQLRKIQAAQAEDAVGRRRARIAAVELDETEDKAIAKLARALPAKVPDEGIGRAELRKKATNGGTRHRFDDAMERAVSGGYLTVTDGRVHRAAR